MLWHLNKGKGLPAGQVRRGPQDPLGRGISPPLSMASLSMVQLLKVNLGLKILMWHVSGFFQVRVHIHMIFIAVHCYSPSILLVIAVSLLLSLMYELNFPTGMYVQENSASGVWYSP